MLVLVFDWSISESLEHSVQKRFGEIPIPVCEIYHKIDSVSCHGYLVMNITSYGLDLFIHF